MDMISTTGLSTEKQSSIYVEANEPWLKALGSHSIVFSVKKDNSQYKKQMI